MPYMFGFYLDDGPTHRHRKSDKGPKRDKSKSKAQRAARRRSR